MGEQTQKDTSELIDVSLGIARSFSAAGVDIIDIGGESTRPGAAPVSLDEEKERVLPIIQALSRLDDFANRTQSNFVNEQQGWEQEKNATRQAVMQALQQDQQQQQQKKKSGFWSKLGGALKFAAPIAASFIPGVGPIAGGMNATTTTSTTTNGGAQGWRGFVARVAYTGGTHRIATRPAQTATTANNQDLVTEGSGPMSYTGAVNLASAASTFSQAASSTLTKTLRLTLAAPATLQIGQAAEIIPLWVQVVGALVLLVMSAKPLYRSLQSMVGRLRRQPHVETCTCAPGTCSTAPLVNIGKLVPADKKKK